MNEANNDNICFFNLTSSEIEEAIFIAHAEVQLEKQYYENHKER